MKEKHLEVEPLACGAGKVADCCIYITASANGICCERDTEFAKVLEARIDKMHAKRIPTQPYPHCQLWDEKGQPK